MSAHQKALWEHIDADETFIRKGFWAPGQYFSAKAKRDSLQSKELPTSWAACQKYGRTEFEILHRPKQLALPSGSLLLLNGPLSDIFFCRTFWETLSLHRCRTEKCRNSRKSSVMGSLLLSQVSISVSLSWSHWFSKNLRFWRGKDCKEHHCWILLFTIHLRTLFNASIPTTSKHQSYCSVLSCMVTHHQYQMIFVFWFSLPRGMAWNCSENDACSFQSSH